MRGPFERIRCQAQLLLPNTSSGVPENSLCEITGIVEIEAGLLQGSCKNAAQERYARIFVPVDN
jgi:hypothetical protein